MHVSIVFWTLVLKLYFMYKIVTSYCSAVVDLPSGFGPKQVSPAWWFLRLPDVKTSLFKLALANFFGQGFFLFKNHTSIYC